VVGHHVMQFARDARAVELAQVAWSPVLAIALAKIAVNLAVAGRYGWHMDELYNVDASRHLDWAYVDFPPIVPLVAALGRAMGGSLVVLRTLASLAGAGVVVVVALVSRELGGRRWAQAVAALCAVPFVMASNSMFQTVSFDQLAWSLMLWAAARVLRTGSIGAWFTLAAATALALETKWTALALVVGLAIGFVVTAQGRARLRGAGPWLVVGAVGAVTVPFTIWQARHGWASVRFFHGRGGEVRADDPPPKFLIEMFLYAGPLAGAIWWRGARRALSRRNVPALGWAMAVVVVGFLVTGGKSYYAAPVLVIPWALGAMAVEERAPAMRRRRLVGLIVVGTVGVVPWILPVLPARVTVNNNAIPLGDDYGREVGWPELAAQVATIWNSLPAGDRTDAAILGSNYGDTGAIARWGRALGLPAPVSGHLTWQWWGPGVAGSATHLLVVGHDPTWLLEHGCRTTQVLDRIHTPHGFENEDTDAPIVWCALRAPLRDVWPELAHLS
jgi:Dolichyl-phosphate-mannose-protein mannosyltransferase